MNIICFYVQMYICVDKQNGIHFIKIICTCKKALQESKKNTDLHGSYIHVYWIVCLKKNKTTTYDRKMIVFVEMEKCKKCRTIRFGVNFYTLYCYIRYSNTPRL